MEGLTIVGRNGKTYNSLRAYHIALGHAVRQALIDFTKEIEEICQSKIAEFYGEYNPSYYDRTGQLLYKMQLEQLIKAEVKGNYQKRITFNINVFDWEVLDAHSNGDGVFGTYTSYEGDDSREEFESFLKGGIYGHKGLDLRHDIQVYIDKNLDDRVQKVLDNF